MQQWRSKEDTPACSCSKARMCCGAEPLGGGASGMLSAGRLRALGSAIGAVTLASAASFVRPAINSPAAEASGRLEGISCAGTAGAGCRWVPRLGVAELAGFSRPRRAAPTRSAAALSTACASRRGSSTRWGSSRTRSWCPHTRTQFCSAVLAMLPSAGSCVTGHCMSLCIQVVCMHHQYPLPCKKVR